MHRPRTDWKPVTAESRQFSLAELLLVLTEAALCLALLQIDRISIFSPILLGMIFLLLHLSRWRVALGVYFGCLVGCGLMLLLSMAFLGDSFHVWILWGLLIVPMCALYGGALHAVISREQLYGLHIIILLLPLFMVVVTCCTPPFGPPK